MIKTRGRFEKKEKEKSKHNNSSPDPESNGELLPTYASVAVT